LAEAGISRRREKDARPEVKWFGFHWASPSRRGGTQLGRGRPFREKKKKKKIKTGLIKGRWMDQVRPSICLERAGGRTASNWGGGLRQHHDGRQSGSAREERCRGRDNVEPLRSGDRGQGVMKSAQGRKENSKLLWRRTSRSAIVFTTEAEEEKGIGTTIGLCPRPGGGKKGGHHAIYYRENQGGSSEGEKMSRSLDRYKARYKRKKGKI